MATASEQKEIFENLAPILTHVNGYLEAACVQATEYFFSQKAPMDSQLASHMVRWSFLRLLQAEADLLGIEWIDELGLNGISFGYHGYHIRVWKADDTDVTHMASSPTNEAFLAQLLFSWVPSRQPLMNIAILWDVDSDWHLQSLRVGPPHKANDRFILDWHFDVTPQVQMLQTGDLESPERDSTDLHFELADEEADDRQG